MATVEKGVAERTMEAGVTNPADKKNLLQKHLKQSRLKQPRELLKM